LARKGSNAKQTTTTTKKKYSDEEVARQGRRWSTKTGLRGVCFFFAVLTAFDDGWLVLSFQKSGESAFVATRHSKEKTEGDMAAVQGGINGSEARQTPKDSKQPFCSFFF
jgi:hypothetical protein